MRFQIFLVLGLVAAACAVPLLDKRQGSLKVVDIPADLFAEESENVETVQAPEQKHVVVDDAVPAEKVADTPAAQVPVEPEEKKEQAEVKPAEEGAGIAPSSLDKEGDKKNPDDDAEEIDRPQVFGFRLPTIIILRRPAIFDDPFSNLFPFFPSFNRRPAFAPAPVPAAAAGDREVDIRDGQQRPAADSSPSEQRPVSVGGSGNIADVMHNVRQHMDSLFSSLFAPNAGLFPNRQFFPRPLFPPVPIDSAEEGGLDFDKLPDNYKNSTHETKVVDGQVVEVNKTVHKISGNNSNGFFQFSVIKIRPSDAPVPEEGKPEEVVPPAAIEEGSHPESGATPEVTTIKAQQEAEMNNPALNEVDNAEKEADLSKTKYETDPGLLEEPSTKSAAADPNAPISLPLTQDVVYDFVPLQSMPLIDATKGKNKPHDLSNDLRVNNLMASESNNNVRLRTLVDPDDVEVIQL